MDPSKSPISEAKEVRGECESEEQQTQPKNPAPESEISGPLHREEQRGDEDWRSRVEHILGEIRQTQLEEKSFRKRAAKRRKRRERLLQQKRAVAYLGTQTQPISTLDWEPPDRGKEDVEAEEVPNPKKEESGGDPDPIQTEPRPVEEWQERRAIEGESNWDKRREALRMVRAAKKVSYDILRATPNEPKPKKQKPEENIIKIYVTVEDKVGLKFLMHWNGVRKEYEVNITKGPWEIRKALMRAYRLKGLIWQLSRRDNRGTEWARLPKLIKIAEEGDDSRLEITGRQRKQPNAPGSSKRRHFARANSRTRAKDFEWSPPPVQRRDVQTCARLAKAGHIGYRELPDQSPVISPEGEEEYRLRRQAETLDILRRKQEDLEERDEWRRKKDEEFRAKYVEPPPPHYVKPLSEDDKRVIRREEAKRKATDKAEAFQRALAEERVEKAKREEQKRAEGKARQAKAEERSQVKKKKR
jgi:hypothetical protein